MSSAGGETAGLWVYLPSLESGFLHLQAVPAQNVSPVPLPSSVSFSLPESGGKDKKMTNMMNGAVAIYGGVGVMEIRQPLPQAVESVAQAVEDLAVNAHISLHELKNTVAAVIEKKLPKYAQLMEMHPVIAARTVVGGATLTAYENGYAVYEEDGAHTVMAINRCGDYRYSGCSLPHSPQCSRCVPGGQRAAPASPYRTHGVFRRCNPRLTARFPPASSHHSSRSA